jgi:hypothetical protein
VWRLTSDTYNRGMHRLAPAFRRLTAGLLTAAALLAALEIGSYKELDTHVGSRPGGGPVLVTREVAQKFGLEMTPAWAIPIAVGVGLLGLGLAILVYRGRSEYHLLSG